MSTESAARKAAEREAIERLLDDYTEEIANAGLRQEPHDFARRIELRDKIIADACQTVAPGICPKCGSKLCQPYKSTETGLWTQRCDKCEYFNSWAGIGAAPAVSTPTLNIGCDAHPNGPMEGCSGCAWINRGAAVSTPRCPKCGNDGTAVKCWKCAAPVEGLRNKIGQFMWERGINMGDKLDAGRVQDLLEEYHNSIREIIKEAWLVGAPNYELSEYCVPFEAADVITKLISVNDESLTEWRKTKPTPYPQGESK